MRANALRPLTLLILALGMAALVRVHMASQPFGMGFDGFLGAMYGSATRNLIRYGPGPLQLAPCLDNGPLDPEHAHRFLHHPPTFVWLVTGVASVLGQSEAVLRLLPSLAMLFAIWLLWCIVLRIACAWTAALTALLFASYPMISIFGSIVNYEPFVMPAALGTYLLYLRYREEQSWRRLALMVGAYALCVSFDWYGVYIAVPIALHAVAAGRHWRVPFGLAASGILTLVAVVAYMEWASPGAMSNLVGRAEHRMSTSVSDFGGGHFSWEQWFGRMWEHNTTLFGPLGGGYILALLGLWWARRQPTVLLHVGLLFIPGLLYILVFPQNAYQHPFLSMMMAPALALASAAGLRQLASAGRWQHVASVVLVVCVVVTMQLSGWLNTRCADCFGLQARAWALFQPSVWPQAFGSEGSGPVRLSEVGWLRIPCSGRPLPAIPAAGHELASVVPFDAGVATPEQDLNTWMPLRYYADRDIRFGIRTFEELAAERSKVGRTTVRFVTMRRDVVPYYLPLVRKLVADGARVFKGDYLLVLELAPRAADGE